MAILQPFGMKSYGWLYSAAVFVALLIPSSRECPPAAVDEAGTAVVPDANGGKGLQGLLKGSVSDGSVADTRCEGEPVEIAEDLSCDDFRCYWKNVGSQEDDLEWFVGDGDPDPSLMEKYTGTRTGPEDEFGYLYPQEKLSSGDRSFFVSCPISCQDGRATVKLKHWITENAKLEVCTRQIDDIEPENCEEIDADDNPGPTTVRIPGSDDPFQIVIQGSGFKSDTDFIIIDDIEYDGELCELVDYTEEPTTERVTERPRTDPEPETDPPDDGETCRFFQCDFNRGTGCNEVARSSSTWKTGSGLTGNRVTGIRGNSDAADRSGSYAYLEGPADGDSLTFPDVNFNGDKELSFQLYKASYESVFKVLIDGSTGFQQDETTVTSRAWKGHRVRIPSGRHTIEFVGSNLDRHEYIGLDDFQLLDGGSPDCL